MPEGAIKTLALLSYAVALAGTGLFGVWVLRLGLAGPGPASTCAAPWPGLIDLGLLVLFGVQHSGMARERFKRWLWPSGARLERSVYAAASGLLLALLVLCWQPLGEVVFWRLPAPFVLLSLAGGLGLFLINTRFDHLGLFGVRQAWSSRPQESEELLVLGPYRYLRHPLMACLLLFLWGQPVLSLDLLLLDAGLSVYILIGLMLEERDLAKRFPAAYADYRRRVPALVPYRWPVPPAHYTARGPGVEGPT
jgi:protein-S-isoprenylcysteine O-methyltransferase Ste14